MGPSVVVIAGISAGIGGFVGATAPYAWRAVGQRLSRPGKLRPATPSRLDAAQLERIHSVSTDWAARQGRPEAAPWAAGFLEDAARFVQRHGGGR